MVPRSMCKDDAEHKQILRDHFAAKALQADLSNWPGDAGDWLKYRDDLAHRYYRMADAMLIARSARPAGGDE